MKIWELDSERNGGYETLVLANRKEDFTLYFKGHFNGKSIENWGNALPEQSGLFPNRILINSIFIITGNRVCNVPVTGQHSHTIANAGASVMELGYTDVTINLSSTKLTGNHDLYVVFNAPDLRIDSLSFPTKMAK